jgi:phospholipase C
MGGVMAGRPPRPGSFLVVVPISLLAGAALLGPSTISGPGPAGGPLVRPATTPIEHVIIVHKENRSFDQYFGRFPGVDGATTGEMHDGTVVALGPGVDPMPNDIAHGPDDWTTAYHDGQMNGFDLEPGAFSEGGQNLAYTAMEEGQIPNYWAYARRYGLGDAFFADYKGASFGNALFRVAAQSGREDGTIGNRAVASIPGGLPIDGIRRWGCDAPEDHMVVLQAAEGEQSFGLPCFDFHALPTILADAGVSWHFYADPTDLSFSLVGLDAVASVRFDPDQWSNVVPLDQFYADATAGTLPSVSWVQPVHTEHPNAGTVCEGENESVRLIDAVMDGPAWSSTVIIVTWDEWGGFYDHVAPPNVDDISYGFRVPVLVISPWVKWGDGSDGGYVSSVFSSHASALRLIESNWRLPSLTTRDSGASDLHDFFDFGQVPKESLILQERACPPLTEDQARLVAARTIEDAD